MNWVVTCQWRGFTNLWKNLVNSKYREGTLNTITVILPNNFELPLFRVFEL